MNTSAKMAQWMASYRSLAERIVADHIVAIQEEFPNEVYPVRPPYRRAMYHRLMLIVDELNSKMEEILEESTDGEQQNLKESLMRLQEHYEQEFVRQVRKEEHPGGSA